MHYKRQKKDKTHVFADTHEHKYQEMNVADNYLAHWCHQGSLEYDSSEQLTATQHEQSNTYVCMCITQCIRDTHKHDQNAVGPFSTLAPQRSQMLYTHAHASGSLAENTHTEVR